MCTLGPLYAMTKGHDPKIIKALEIHLKVVPLEIEIDAVTCQV